MHSQLPAAWAVGGLLALVPAACGFDGGGGDDGDASDTTAFRTITVQIETTAPPSVVTVQGGAPVEASGETYTIQPGDYWIKIADDHGVTLEALLAVNDADTDTHLTPGEEVNLPTGAAASLPPETGEQTNEPVDGTTGNTYQIKAGDYWIKIADDHDVSLQDLLDVNGATTATVLRPGEFIRLPPSSG